MGILLASYDKFKTIAPGVWSLKNTEHNSNNLVKFIVSNKESYSVDMYSLLNMQRDLSNYVGYNAQFERDICIKVKVFK